MNPLLAASLLPKQPETWQPISRRLAGEPLEDPIEDFPNYLRDGLVHWAERQVKEDLARKVLLRLRMQQMEYSTMASSLCKRLANPYVDRALDILDALVFFGRLPLAKALDELEEILFDGGSVWRVDLQEGCLERRVDSATKALVQQARESAARSGRDEASALLATAWAKTYGVHPEPDAAYAAAVKAVEFVAGRIVLPKNTDPSLGQVLSTLDQGRQKYEMAIPAADGNPASIDAFVSVLELFYRGHRDRHAGGSTNVPTTQASAEAAVPLAALLVHWFTQGVVRKLPDQPKRRRKSGSGGEVGSTTAG
ncbi:hypothetical protein [Kitasatospora phosalacinea]|nr:hypothetical protein [Kitasatospora phosalacinea]